MSKVEVTEGNEGEAQRTGHPSVQCFPTRGGARDKEVINYSIAKVK